MRKFFCWIVAAVVASTAAKGVTVSGTYTVDGAGAGSYNASIEKSSATTDCNSGAQSVTLTYSGSVTGQGIVSVAAWKGTNFNTSTLVLYEISSTGFSGSVSVSLVEGESIWFRPSARKSLNTSTGAITYDDVAYEEAVWTNGVRGRRFNFRNEQEFHMSYVVTTGAGQVLQNVELAPGQEVRNLLVMAPCGENLSVAARATNKAFRDGEWVEVGDVIYNEGVGVDGGPVGPVVPTGDGGPTVTPNQPDGDGDTQPADTDADGDTDGNVTGVKTTTNVRNIWNSNSGVQTDLLTNTVYREGVDKLSSRLDAIKTNTRETADNTKKIAKFSDDQQALKSAAPTLANMTATGNTARGDTLGAFGAFPTSVTAKTASGSAPSFAVTLPAAFGGRTFNLNPFTSERFAGICEWLKTAIAWLFGVLFFVHLAPIVRSTAQGISEARQAQGNALLGGTGAQATALTAATVITGIVVAAILAAITLALSDFGLGTMASLWSANPYAGLPGGVAYMLDQVFPLGAGVAYLLLRPLAEIAFLKIQLGAAAAIRFVVP